MREHVKDALDRLQNVTVTNNTYRKIAVPAEESHEILDHGESGEYRLSAATVAKLKRIQGVEVAGADESEVAVEEEKAPKTPTRRKAVPQPSEDAQVTSAEGA